MTTKEQSMRVVFEAAINNVCQLDDQEIHQQSVFIDEELVHNVSQSYASRIADISGIYSNHH
jgi:hypothetical protein